MIRREIKLEQDGPLWLLVSQVEHARISGELAAVWEEQFPAEVIEAIKHHDDGWAHWEGMPQIDPRQERPFSFLELPAADAMTIWEGSIAEARKIGPLAGWIVAGHFMALLARSDHSQEPLAQQWLQLMAGQRATWLTEWQNVSPANSLQIAARAQRMLLVTDLFSLWLCCDCPLAGNSKSILNESDMKERTAAVLGLYQFEVRESSLQLPSDRNQPLQLSWTLTIKPWPLVVDELTLATEAKIVPARQYRNVAELTAADSPADLHWRLSRPA